MFIVMHPRVGDMVELYTAEELIEKYGVYDKDIKTPITILYPKMTEFLGKKVTIKYVGTTFVVFVEDNRDFFFPFECIRGYTDDNTQSIREKSSHNIDVGLEKKILSEDLFKTHSPFRLSGDF